MSTVPALIAVAKAVVILHNMVTVERREGYVSRTRRGYGAGAAGSGVPAGDGGGAAPEGEDGAGADGGAPAAAGVGPGGGVGALGPAGGLGGGGELPPLAGPVPVVHPIAQSAHVRAMLAWREVRSPREHAALREDLAEHVWEHRREALEPYLE